MNVIRAAAIALAATIVLSSCANAPSPADTTAPEQRPAVGLSPAPLGAIGCAGADQVSHRPDHATFCQAPAALQ